MHKLILITGSSCSRCEVAKQILKSHKIEFEEKDFDDLEIDLKETIFNHTTSLPIIYNATEGRIESLQDVIN